MKRIAVIGSRDYKSLHLIPQWLNFAKEKFEADSGGIVIVSGGARGVDKAADDWAIENKINRDIFMPNYNQHSGKTAPLIRNKKIVENSDFLIAFWNEESTGTEYSLNYAKKLGKTCIIVFEDGVWKRW